MFWRKADPVCYIHIGPHKTGTSTIQHFMSANSARLEKLGAHYPRLVDPTGRKVRNHAMLAARLGRDVSGSIDPEAPHWRDVVAIASKRRRDIVLSSEHFARGFRRPRTLDAVTDLFQSLGYRIKIIAYVRDQPIWLNSWYMQSQKRFVSNVSFEAFIAKADETGIVDPWRYLETMLDNSRMELEVVSFEAAVRAGLENDFLRRIGVSPAAGLKPAQRRNLNAGAKSVFAAQEIMRRGPDDIRALPAYRPIYKRFRSRYEKLGWNVSPYIGLTDEISATIRSRYRESNMRFADARLGAPWPELCPDRNYATNIFSPASATPEENREIEGVIEELLQLIAASRTGSLPMDRELVARMV